MAPARGGIGPTKRRRIEHLREAPYKKVIHPSSKTWWGLEMSATGASSAVRNP